MGKQYSYGKGTEELSEIEQLKLKNKQKEIKAFIDWCSEGDSTLKQRYEMLIERKASVEAQMEELKKTMDLIDHKCWYYKTAIDAGTEDIHKEDKIVVPNPN
ncbi:MAG: MerR family transcriptional regulator [Neobacillus sp.]|nr:MerR family transcriptional regulator [Neobacillus sp.]